MASPRANWASTTPMATIVNVALRTFDYNSMIGSKLVHPSLTQQLSGYNLQSSSTLNSSSSFRFDPSMTKDEESNLMVIDDGMTRLTIHSLTANIKILRDSKSQAKLMEHTKT